MVPPVDFGSVPKEYTNSYISRSTTKRRVTRTDNVMALLTKLLQVLGFVKHKDKTKQEDLSGSTEKIFPDHKKTVEKRPSFSGSLTSSSSFSVLESSGIASSPTSETSCDYGTFATDLATQENIANQVKDLVASSPFCNVYMKDYIAMKVADDVMDLAKNEPCGLKGCRVLVFLEDRGERTVLGSLLPEEGFICTFEVSVLLCVKKRRCALFLPFASCMPRGQQINTSYDIWKDKLYTCSNSRTPTPVNW